MLEKFIDQGSGRTDVAVELDLADIAFDRTQHEYRASVDRLELAADDGEDVAVGSIFGLEILDNRVEARSARWRRRHRHRAARSPPVGRPSHLPLGQSYSYRRAFRQRRHRRWRRYRHRRCDFGLGGGTARQRRRYQRRNVDSLAISGDVKPSVIKIRLNARTQTFARDKPPNPRQSAPISPPRWLPIGSRQLAWRLLTDVATGRRGAFSRMIDQN